MVKIIMAEREEIIVEVKTLEKEKILSTVPEAKARSFFRFFEDIKEEAKKITWTSKEELWTYALLVLGATFLFGLGIYCVDLAIQFALYLLSFVMGWIFG